MKFHPKVPMVRYADDVVIHCRSYTESQEVLSSLKRRREVCKLTAHPEKTKIVYCKKSKRQPRTI
jgi:RNA-directed DNA polymerase